MGKIGYFPDKLNFMKPQLIGDNASLTNTQIYRSKRDNRMLFFKGVGGIFEDTYTASWRPNKNYSAGTLTQSMNGIYKCRALFNCHQPNKILHLYCYATSETNPPYTVPMPIDMHEITNAVNISTVTWNTQPPSLGIIGTFAPILGWNEVLISDTGSVMLVMQSPPEEYAWVQFSSMEGHIIHRPYITDL